MASSLFRGFSCQIAICMVYLDTVKHFNLSEQIETKVFFVVNADIFECLRIFFGGRNEKEEM